MMRLILLGLLLATHMSLSVTLVTNVESNAEDIAAETSETSAETEDFDIDQYDFNSGRRSLQGDKSAFNIDFAFGTVVSAAQKDGFLAARTRWTEVITGDNAATVCVPQNTKMCGYRFVKKTCIDDLLIIVKINKIDGPGKILGQSGPCAMSMGKVRIGTMQFDRADANMLIKQNSWQATILHEMGHVLGIGTLWDSNDLITPQGSQPPFYYFGTGGNAGLKEDWGSNAGKLIVEDQGGPGTARGHWKESVYDNELMTGYIERAGVKMPMSLITVKSLEDLGYVVDASKADPFPKPSGRRLRSKDKIAVGNDILAFDIIELDDLTPKKGREDDFKAEKEAWEAKKKKKNSH